MSLRLNFARMSRKIHQSMAPLPRLMISPVVTDSFPIPPTIPSVSGARQSRS